MITKYRCKATIGGMVSPKVRCVKHKNHKANNKGKIKHDFSGKD